MGSRGRRRVECMHAKKKSTNNDCKEGPEWENVHEPADIQDGNQAIMALSVLSFNRYPTAPLSILGHVPGYSNWIKDGVWEAVS
jgi:hypothetical protein